MIKLRRLERRYPLGKEKFFYVLRDINLDIAKGEFVSVMGPSGAGKSTLLHILGMHDHGWEGEYFLGEAGRLSQGHTTYLSRRRSREFYRTAFGRKSLAEVFTSVPLFGSDIGRRWQVAILQPFKADALSSFPLLTHVVEIGHEYLQPGLRRHSRISIYQLVLIVV